MNLDKILAIKYPFYSSKSGNERAEWSKGKVTDFRDRQIEAKVLQPLSNTRITESMWASYILAGFWHLHP